MAWCKVIPFGKHTHNTHISYIYIHIWKNHIFSWENHPWPMASREMLVYWRVYPRTGPKRIVYDSIVAGSCHRDHPGRWYQQYVLLKPPKHQMISARNFEKRIEQLAPKLANWEFEFPAIIYALLFADKSTHVKYICLPMCFTMIVYCGGSKIHEQNSVPIVNMCAWMLG